MESILEHQFFMSWVIPSNAQQKDFIFLFLLLHGVLLSISVSVKPDGLTLHWDRPEAK